jgi:hypothetical protein
MLLLLSTRKLCEEEDAKRKLIIETSSRKPFDVVYNKRGEQRSDESRFITYNCFVFGIGILSIWIVFLFVM